MSPTGAYDAATARLRLRFLQYRIDIETNSLRVARRLQQYFRPYLANDGSAPHAVLYARRQRPEYDPAKMRVWKRPAHPDRAPKESYYDARGVRYILKNRTGVLIKLREHEAEIVGDVLRHSNQVVNLVGTLFGLSLVQRGYAMLHASGVVRSGTDDAMIFLGNSGSGKSSVALQLLERGGYDYLSNDRVLLRVDKGRTHVIGIPKKPRVNPGTLLASTSLSRLLSSRKRPLYDKMPREELWMIEDKTDVDVARALGARERLDGYLAHAYSLGWSPSGSGLATAALDPNGALEAMRTTAKDFGVFDRGLAERSAEREHLRIADAVAFTRVAGKADPKALSRELRASKV